MNLTKATLSFDDGSTQEFEVTPSVLPTEIMVGSAAIEQGSDIA